MLELLHPGGDSYCSVLKPGLGYMAKCGWETFDILSIAATDGGNKDGISCLLVALLLPASCAADHSRTRPGGSVAIATQTHPPQLVTVLPRRAGVR